MKFQRLVDIRDGKDQCVDQICPLCQQKQGKEVILSVHAILMILINKNYNDCLYYMASFILKSIKILFILFFFKQYFFSKRALGLRHQCPHNQSQHKEAKPSVPSKSLNISHEEVGSLLGVLGGCKMNRNSQLCPLTCHYPTKGLVEVNFAYNHSKKSTR